MARGSSGFVAGLTAAAIAAVGFLAYQASASVPDSLGKPRVKTSPKPTVPKAPEDKKNVPAALPGDSGTGERVVYALGDDRVWLVGADGKVRRTFEVTPGTVDPAPGTYQVTSKRPSGTGSDGVQVEHIVVFTLQPAVIGFSAAIDGSTSAPDASKKLGGIRESRADGTALWEFTKDGEKVVVVP
ncbi:hypothetical protein NGF19_11750 [Streptomyces sp. RY43-2]|uniref:L,D-transpeptidase n=1 Tax=Streptomyces macrolidinus TaxID=2952607 RepID=A0ABT0ZD10_9ACTN|nr:hypothetical protein [Streptomyces macrolidinus]MCN9241454.1 hypothetical protein [Streptomyces macrolidinus]